jgi:hypothetical protein
MSNVTRECARAHRNPIVPHFIAKLFRALRSPIVPRTKFRFQRSFADVQCRKGMTGNRLDPVGIRCPNRTNASHVCIFDFHDRGSIRLRNCKSSFHRMLKIEF